MYLGQILTSAHWVSISVINKMDVVSMSKDHTPVLVMMVTVETGGLA